MKNNTQVGLRDKIDSDTGTQSTWRRIRFGAEKSRTVIFATVAAVVWLTPSISHGADSRPAVGVQLSRVPLVQLGYGIQTPAVSPTEIPALSSAVKTNPFSYAFTFGVIDYPRSQLGLGVGINDGGQIVGGYNNTNINSFTADHGFRLIGDKYSTVDYPGAVQTEVIGINKKGHMVGAILDSISHVHGFKLVGGVFAQLDYPGADFTVAVGINNSGVIVGTYAIGGTAYGYVLKNGIYTSIAVNGAIYTYLSGINNNGIIVGYYFDLSLNTHGFTWNNGIFTTLDYGNGYPNTYLAGITDGGVILGAYGSPVTINSSGYLWEHGFLYSGGTFSIFDAPFGDVAVTQPFGINNNDEIVGGYVDGQGMLYGFYAKAQ
jgi:uncharacterized membrane protein